MKPIDFIKGSKILGFILAVFIVFVLISNKDNSHRADIESVIKNESGNVISIDTRSWDIGPFWYSKNTHIYKIIYKDKSNITKDE